MDLLSKSPSIPLFQRGRQCIAVTLVLLSMLIAACSSPPSDSPEDQIRALVAKGEKAAEEKDLATLKELVSDSYKDENGRKPELMKILAMHLLRNASVHLLTRIRSIEFPEPKTAKVTVFVAMAGGGELTNLQDLLQYRADMYRVDFTAADEGRAQWKVTSAAWRPADTSDFE